MNIKSQIAFMRVLIKKNYKATNRNYDEIVDNDWEAEMDPTLEFGENVTLFYELGILEGPLLGEHNKEEEKRILGDLKQKYRDSLTPLYYKCAFCDDFYTYAKILMEEHLREFHDMEGCDIPPDNPYDMTYIIIDELINTSQSKEFKNKQYITVSNEFLWKQLLKRLGYNEIRASPL